jgi:hypothetical protein
MIVEIHHKHIVGRYAHRYIYIFNRFLHDFKNRLTQVDSREQAEIGIRLAFGSAAATDLSGSP